MAILAFVILNFTLQSLLYDLFLFDLFETFCNKLIFHLWHRTRGEMNLTLITWGGLKHFKDKSSI